MNILRKNIKEALDHARQLRGEVQIVKVNGQVFLRNQKEMILDNHETLIYQGEGKFAKDQSK